MFEDMNPVDALLSEIIVKIHGELVEKYSELFGKKGFNQKNHMRERRVKFNPKPTLCTIYYDS